jgi:hypothetical protein
MTQWMHKISMQGCVLGRTISYLFINALLIRTVPTS